LGVQAGAGGRQHSKSPARSVLLAVAMMPEKVGGHNWDKAHLPASGCIMPGTRKSLTWDISGECVKLHIELH
jgi:hypothetical protein